MRPVVLAVEIGGTTLRVARVTDGSRGAVPALVERARAEAPNHLDGRGDIEGRLVRGVEALSAAVLGGRRPDLVGVAFPGPVTVDGRSLSAPTLLGGTDRQLDVRAALGELWPAATTTVVNDLTAAGLRLVHAYGLADFCVITVGSGVGHKIFSAGRPLLGPAARGGEIGHLRVDLRPDALPCECGGLGHVGAIASGRGTLALLRCRAAREHIPYGGSALGHLAPAAVTNEHLASAYRSADQWVESVVTQAASALGTAVAAIHLACGVEDVVLVGGWARALGPTYPGLVAAGAVRAAWDGGQDWSRLVRLGPDDDDYGLVGAALAALSASGVRPA